MRGRVVGDDPGLFRTVDSARGVAARLRGFRDGSKASNILKAARTFGLDTKGYSLEVDELDEYPLPMIIYWNFNHFLVLEGIRGDQVYLNDPAKGPRQVSRQEFDEAFTGVAITFTPGPGFTKGGHAPSILRSLRRRADGIGVGLAFVILAGLFLVIPGLVIPAFSTIFVDDIIIQGTHGWIRPFLLAMGITALVRFLLYGLQQYALLRMTTRLAVTGSRDFMAHVLKLPMEFYLQRMPGDLNNRVSSNDQVAQMLSGQTATSVVNIFMVVFFTPIMFFFDAMLTGAALLIALLNLLLLRHVASRQALLNQQIQADIGKTMGVCTSGLGSIETLKASGGEDDFFSQWAGHLARITNGQQELGFFAQLMSGGPQLLSGLGNLTILCLGCWRVMDGHLTLGMLVGFQSLYASFIGPVQQLVNLGSTFQQAGADLARLDDVLHYKVDPRFATTAPDRPVSAPAKLRGHLELRQISFGYSRLEPALLSEFSLLLPPGGRVALVGASGSGKSTIAKLVTGLYRPWSGEILLDGQPLGDISGPLFANSVALVDQDIILFSGTIRENLTMWDHTIPEEVVVQAAKDACIHEVIASRPLGYESLLEQGGGNFSGGQRQRLEIARALATNPRLLVMDEATSALDPLTEKKIDENLRRRGCTCLIIAHRLSTIRDADEIVVLEGGVVVERGTHDRLSKGDGPYARLIRLH
jgi:NHLM bacteriocin system ABC transporter peptidase/ATP-binding protein